MDGFNFLVVLYFPKSLQELHTESEEIYIFKRKERVKKIKK